LQYDIGTRKKLIISVKHSESRHRGYGKVSTSSKAKDINFTDIAEYQATGINCNQRKKHCTIILTRFAVYGNTNKTAVRHLSIAELPSLLRTNWLVSKRVGPGNQEQAQSTYLTKHNYN